VPLSDDEVKGLVVSNSLYGTFGMTRTLGFTAEIKNNTDFIVTEVTSESQSATALPRCTASTASIIRSPA
jgi:hypothetical protein